MSPARLLWLALLLLAPVATPTPAAAQKVHEIRLQVDRAKSLYRFIPASVTAAPGDILVFKVVNGAPHGIVFETKHLSPEVRGALVSAFGRRSGDPASPMLAKDGQEYRLILPKIPAGKYRYFCLPHRAYDEAGEIIIEK